MERNSNQITVAASSCNLVTNINQEIKTHLKRIAEAKKKIENFQTKECVLFSEDVNMPLFSANTGNDRYYTDLVLDRMEIICSAKTNFENNFFGLSLALNLFSKKECFSFIVAKTKNYGEIFVVSSIEDILEIISGSSANVKFIFQQDFLQVISFIDEVVEEFKNNLADTTKLDYHLKKFSTRWNRIV